MRRIEATVGLIERYPGVGRRLAKRQSVRVLPLGRYPYRIYYCIENDVPTVLHVRHAARRLPRTRDLE